MIVSGVNFRANNSLDSLIDYLSFGWFVCLRFQRTEQTAFWHLRLTMIRLVATLEGFPLNLLILFSSKGPVECMIGVFFVGILHQLVSCLMMWKYNLWSLVASAGGVIFFTHVECFCCCRRFPHSLLVVSGVVIFFTHIYGTRKASVSIVCTYVLLKRFL